MKHLSDEQLQAYSQESLSTAERETVRLHLDRCDTCTARYDERFESAPLGASAGKLGPVWEEVQRGDLATRNWPLPKAYEFLTARWNFVKLLGSGGHGAVYQATRKNPLDGPPAPETVALKVMTASPHDMRRIERELEIMKRRDLHPALVPAYQLVIQGATVALEMECINGLTWGEFVRQRSAPLSEKEACGLVLRALPGLDWLRRADIVHRDLKPSNLMRNVAGDVKILDYGLAKVFTPEHEPGITITRQFEGTPAYASPEQRDDPKNVDVRSDLYSLGCVTYFLLAGRPPFGNDPPRRAKGSRPPSLANAMATPRCNSIIQRLLEFDPQRRYQSYGDLGHDLADLADEASRQSVSKWLAETPRPQPAMRWWRRTRLAAIVIVLLVFAIFGGIVLSFQTSDGTIRVELSDQQGAEELKRWEVVFNQTKYPATVLLKQEGDDRWLEIKAEPGKHRLCVSRPDFQLFCKEVELRSRGSVPVRISWQPIASPPPPPPRKSLGDPGVPIQVVDHLDVGQHFFKPVFMPGDQGFPGGVQKEGDTITIEPASVLAIPWSPQEGYELKLTVERLEPGNALLLGNRVRVREVTSGEYREGRFEVMIDGWPVDGFRSGVWRLDNRSGRQSMQESGLQLEVGKETDIVVHIQHDEVRVSLGGKALKLEKENTRQLTYISNASSRLRLPEQRLPRDRPYPLYLRTSNGKFRITRFTLTPLDGPATLIP